jgi:hypothetical protein
MRSRFELRRSWLAGLALAILATGNATAADQAWRTKPANEWTVDDALEVLRDSDLAHEEDVLIIRGASPFTMDGRLRTRTPRNPFGGWATYIVRWETARPVMQAFERLDDLGQETTALYQGRPPQLPEEYYVITVKSLRLPRSGVDVIERLGEENLLRVTELSRPGLTVKPVRVERSGMGASAAIHFYFPASADGQALLSQNPQEVEFRVKSKRFQLNSKFKLERQWIPQSRNGN